MEFDFTTLKSHNEDDVDDHNKNGDLTYPVTELNFIEESCKAEEESCRKVEKISNIWLTLDVYILHEEDCKLLINEKLKVTNT